MSRRIYIEQFGGFWSLTERQWIGLIDLMVNGDQDYDLDAIAKRVNKPSCVHKGRGESGDHWIDTTKHDLYCVLDWTQEDWKYAAEQWDVEITK